MKKRMGLTNKRAVKAYILAKAKETRPGWDCTRVSKMALAQLEHMFIKTLNRAIHQHPTRGKTFRDILE